MSQGLIKQDQEQPALAVTTLKVLCETYSPKACPRIFKGVRNEIAAIDSGAPTLGMIRRELGEKAVEAYLKLWFVDLNQLLDLKKPLNERQIDDMAFRILDAYGSLNLADITLIFRRVLDGDSGLMYDRLSIPTVMKWFKSYFDHRCSAAGERSRLNADKYRGGAIANLPRTAETANDRKGGIEKGANFRKGLRRQRMI